MRKIGIRAAKARLRHLLHDVQQGGEWWVTDRGKPVARIVPVSQDALSLSVRLRLLEEHGIIDPPTRDQYVLPLPLPLEEGVAQRWLEEDRDRGR